MNLNVISLGQRARKGWDAICIFAEINPSEGQIALFCENSGMSRKALVRKVMAVRWAMNGGLTVAGVQNRGQERIMSEYLKAMNGQKEPRLNVTLGVRESQKPILQMQIERIKEILRSKDNPATTEDFADWLASHLEQLSDNEIRNHAMGVGS